MSKTFFLQIFHRGYRLPKVPSLTGGQPIAISGFEQICSIFFRSDCKSQTPVVLQNTDHYSVYVVPLFTVLFPIYDKQLIIHLFCYFCNI